ncbi:hypothetical protein [Naasia sp. SYSU D00948]|nr:hypothetical protein [Naasia sp. SYSU D00948]
MRRTLTSVAQWLRVEHAGAPRWLFAFLIVFAVVLTTVLLAYARS